MKRRISTLISGRKTSDRNSSINVNTITQISQFQDDQQHLSNRVNQSCQFSLQSIQIHQQQKQFSKTKKVIKKSNSVQHKKDPFQLQNSRQRSYFNQKLLLKQQKRNQQQQKQLNFPKLRKNQLILYKKKTTSLLVKLSPVIQQKNQIKKQISSFTQQNQVKQKKNNNNNTNNNKIRQNNQFLQQRIKKYQLDKKVNTNKVVNSLIPSFKLKLKSKAQKLKIQRCNNNKQNLLIMKTYRIQSTLNLNTEQKPISNNPINIKSQSYQKQRHISPSSKSNSRHKKQKFQVKRLWQNKAIKVKRKQYLILQRLLQPIDKNQQKQFKKQTLQFKKQYKRISSMQSKYGISRIMSHYSNAINTRMFNPRLY